MSLKEKETDLGGNKWVNSVHDYEADLDTIASCVTLADLQGDGETKLIGAHIGKRCDMKLKVYKGVIRQSESVLADVPIAITAFINEQTSVPSLAVASGASLLIYKNLRPFYKFTVPSGPINSVEEEAWSKVNQQELTKEDLFTVIKNLASQISPKKLTPTSQTLLITPAARRTEFIDRYVGKTLSNASPITYATTMKKSSADNIDMLVCGTERGAVHIVDSQAFNTVATVTIPDTPFHIIAYGVFDVDYRIFVATRSGQVFSMKRDTANVERPIITCKTHIVAMAMMNKTLAVATVDEHLCFYSMKGKRLSTIKTPGPIQGLASFYYQPKQYTGILVMVDRQVRLYSDRYLLDVIKMERNLTWMKFGSFGREDAALIMGIEGGGIHVKLFRRKATLDDKLDLNPHPKAHNLKLAIPKKTRFFIDETIREKESAVAINQAYLKDLLLLRHLISSSYLSLVKSSMTTISNTPESVEINIEVNGFGPRFRVTARISTAGTSSLYDMWLCFCSPNPRYRFDQPLMPIGVITPGHFYTYTTMVECLQPDMATSDVIRVLLTRDDKTTPIVAAIVTMPISELNILD